MVLQDIWNTGWHYPTLFLAVHPERGENKEWKFNAREGFLALCQFDISFGDFGILPEIFSTKQLKAVFSRLMIFLSPGMAFSICEGIAVPDPFSNVPPTDTKKAVHTL